MDNSFHDTPQKAVVSLDGLRLGFLPYMFIWVVYYAWVVVFTTWWTASPLSDNVFSTDLRSVMHAVNLIASSIIIFNFKKEWFINSARIGAVSVVIGVVICLTAANAQIRLISAAGIGISLAFINIAILMPFTFTLNNTEKFYSVVGSNFLINIVTLFLDGHIMRNDTEVLFSLVVLLFSLCAIFFFKKTDIHSQSKTSTENYSESSFVERPKAERKLHFFSFLNIASDPDDKLSSVPETKSKIYMTISMNCIVGVLYKGAAKGILNIAASNTGTPVLLWYSIGGVAGCLVYIAIFAFFSKRFHLTWTVPFSCLAMGLLCNALASQKQGLELAFAALLGVGGTIGMINMYYMLGVIGKKYNSLRYLGLSILFIGICGGVSGIVLGNFINLANSINMSIIVSIISMIAMIVCFMMSPTIDKLLYDDIWVRDSVISEIKSLPEATEKVEQTDRFENLGLTPREKEVAALLLNAYTMRQISGELHISQGTVNTHTTNLYRKLKINSRIELFKRFGVSSENVKEE